MSTTDTLPTIVECVTCHSTYVVPVSSVSDDFEARRALDWLNTHRCEASGG